jgi:hypothetical protein
MCVFVDSTASDELDYLPVLVSLPPSQTIFEYLIGCWKRINAARSALIKKVRDLRSQSSVLHGSPSELSFELGLYAFRYEDRFGRARKN